MITMRRYATEPPIVTTLLDDVWAVVVPKARTNLVTNPSLETNTTNWFASGGSIARSTTQQYHGAYSLAVTPTAGTIDGAGYGLISLTSGTLYAVSVKVLGIAGVPYQLELIDNTATTVLIRKQFRGTGRWQWVWLYYKETSTTTRYIVIIKDSSTNTGVFYLDGLQVEALVDASESVSTYIDGDQQGLVPNQVPPAYYWNGTPHASTSTRSGLTRAGGEVKFFRDYGFTLMAMIGLGLSVPQNVATEYARLDGGYDDYTRKPTRQFTLTGRFDGRSPDELRANRGGLAQFFDRDLSSLDQRLLLTHYVEDQCGVIASSTSRVLAKYQGGLDGNSSSQVAEQANITFTLYMPSVFADNEAGSALSVQTSISNGLRILQRSAGGVWSNLSTGANSNVWSLFYASDGKLYAGGEFTSIGGVAANRIAYWDGSAWNAMGTGMAGVGKAVYSIVEGPDGSIYAAGDGSDFGGVANTAGLGKWNGAAWSSITATASPNSYVLKLLFGPDGVLYAGGGFTTINGVAAVRVAKMSVAGTWTAMAGGSATDVYAMARFGNRIYIAGDIDSDALSDVAYWTGSAWTSIGEASAAALLRAMDIGPNGTVYVGGNMTTMGGVTTTSVAQFRGNAWEPMGTGLTKSGGGEDVSVLRVLPDGTVLAGGAFDTASGITTIRNITRWNGSAWVFIDVDIGWTSIRAIASKPDGTLTIGGVGLTSTGVAAATTTITNTGTARSYPTIIINGPSASTARIYQITNLTTGRSIYLNLTISAGEVVTMIFQPDNLSFTSDFQGNIASAILPGSNTADFFLQPGANVISFFSADSTVTATAQWRPAFASLDNVP